MTDQQEPIFVGFEADPYNSELSLALTSGKGQDGECHINVLALPMMEPIILDGLTFGHNHTAVGFRSARAWCEQCKEWHNMFDNSERKEVTSGYIYL